MFGEDTWISSSPGTTRTQPSRRKSVRRQKAWKKNPPKPWKWWKGPCGPLNQKASREIHSLKREHGTGVITTKRPLPVRHPPAGSSRPLGDRRDGHFLRQIQRRGNCHGSG